MTRSARTDVWLFMAALNGLLAVAAGAFGAHALKSRLTPADLAVFDTGARYHMYHALALVGVAWARQGRGRGAAAASGACMVGGIGLFCGSLYAIALLGWRWLGPVTPVGGGMMMLGWLFLAAAALRRGLPEGRP